MPSARRPRPRGTIVPALLAALGLSSCSGTYYAIQETFGVHKREILVDRVQAGREDQEEAKEQFQTTFERMKELSGFSGGDLEKRYETLSDEYESSVSRAQDVRDRIESIEDVAAALFDEWQEEIGTYHSEKLEQRSQKMLDDTRGRYDTMIAAMKVAESKMQPVLDAFYDQVMFLKHDLNAQAIASLQESVVEIESDIGRLIADMQTSIEATDEFLKSMDESAPPES